MEDRKQTGRDRRYFRPGSGFFSSKMRVLAREMRYQIVLGGIYPHDAQIGYEWLNAKHILSMVRPGGIIICHDRRSWTVGMLRRVLPELKRRGYKVVGVGELMKIAEEGKRLEGREEGVVEGNEDGGG